MDENREEWGKLLKGLNEYEKKYIIREKENFLLDSYSSWLETKEEKYKLQTLNITFELATLGVAIDLKKLFPSEE